MPWSGGVYTRGYASWVADANNSLPISATKFDTEDNDFASGLNNCATVDGLNAMQASFVPSATTSYDLGSSSKVWRALYAQYIKATSSAVQGYGPTAGALVDMTPDKGSWTSTLSGPYTSNPSGTLKWEKQGTQVTIWCDANIYGTSTSPAQIAASGLPAEITPSSNRNVFCFINFNTSFLGAAQAIVQTSNIITFSVFNTVLSGNGYTGPGGNLPTGNNVGIQAGWSITYSL